MQPMHFSVAQQRLASGLAHWLGYEFACQRGYLFSEKYLALPTGQLLMGSFGKTVYAECDHPILSTQGRLGRPPQIDFLVGSKTSPIVAVETKWVGTSTCSAADLVWDCARLQLAAKTFGCDALLVLGGLNKSIDSLFSSPQFRKTDRKGRPRNIMPIGDNGRRGVVVNAKPGPLRTALDKQLSKFPNVEFPRAVLVSHPHVRPRDTFNLSFRVYVWRIFAEPVRGTFRALGV